jgi:hypothetical protein
MKLSDLLNVLDDDSLLTFDVRGVCKDGNAVYIPYHGGLTKAFKHYKVISCQCTRINPCGSQCYRIAVLED